MKRSEIDMVVKWSVTANIMNMGKLFKQIKYYEHVLPFPLA